MKAMTILGVFLAASLAMGAGIPANHVTGQYVEARTADVYTGPCFANAEVGLVGELAVFGWKIQQGAWDGVKLDGLSVAAAVRANSTLGDISSPIYPVKSVLLVDEKASPAQRLALQAFARRMGGDLLQDVVRVYYTPISFHVEGDNVHMATAEMTAGTLAKLSTRALADGDEICHNEEIWYQPLTKVGHAMPAVTVAHDFRGSDLGATWSSPDKRSAFVAEFHYQD